jgi:hypothetical protein
MIKLIKKTVPIDEICQGKARNKYNIILTNFYSSSERNIIICYDIGIQGVTELWMDDTRIFKYSST